MNLLQEQVKNAINEANGWIIERLKYMTNQQLINRTISVSKRIGSLEQEANELSDEQNSELRQVAIAVKKIWENALIELRKELTKRMESNLNERY